MLAGTNVTLYLTIQYLEISSHLPFLVSRVRDVRHAVQRLVAIRHSVLKPHAFNSLRLACPLFIQKLGTCC